MHHRFGRIPPFLNEERHLAKNCANIGEKLYTKWQFKRGTLIFVLPSIQVMNFLMRILLNVASFPYRIRLKTKGRPPIKLQPVFFTFWCSSCISCRSNGFLRFLFNVRCTVVANAVLLRKYLVLVIIKHTKNTIIECSDSKIYFHILILRTVILSSKVS